jgi:hypothetical protein
MISSKLNPGIGITTLHLAGKGNCGLFGWASPDQVAELDHGDVGGENVRVGIDAEVDQGGPQFIMVPTDIPDHKRAFHSPTVTS